MVDLAASPTAAAEELPPAIEVDGVSASYRVRLDSKSMWEDVRRLAGRGAPDRLIPALRDVSFTVPRGSVLGVIGRNGAGKTTLLRTIAGILAPEEGQVVVRGQISALLSTGVGFNDKLTGRENIRLGGLAMGLSPERLDDIADSIAEFAQLDEYINFPVRTYSSGMKSRLAVAVAAELDPEVLLMDEALSGGDAAFKEHIAHKMAELCSDKRTVVLVTHGLSSVRTMATEAMWLHQGQVAEFGDPDEVVAKYMRWCRLEALEMEMDDE